MVSPVIHAAAADTPDLTCTTVMVALLHGGADQIYTANKHDTRALAFSLSLVLLVVLQHTS